MGIKIPISLLLAEYTIDSITRAIITLQRDVVNLTRIKRDTDS
jgi:hypothetical protein